LDGLLPVLWPPMAQTICKKSMTQETSEALELGAREFVWQSP